MIYNIINFPLSVSPCRDTVPCHRIRRHHLDTALCRRCCSRKDDTSDNRSNLWHIFRTLGHHNRSCRDTDLDDRIGIAWRPTCTRRVCSRLAAPDPRSRVCIGRSVRRRSGEDIRNDRCRDRTRDRVAHTSRTL